MLNLKQRINNLPYFWKFGLRLFIGVSIILEGLWIGFILEQLWPSTTDQSNWYWFPLLVTYVSFSGAIILCGMIAVESAFKKPKERKGDQ